MFDLESFSGGKLARLFSKNYQPTMLVCEMPKKGLESVLDGTYSEV